MNVKLHLVSICWFCAWLLAFPAQLPAQANGGGFLASTNGDGTCTINGYAGTGGTIAIPTKLAFTDGEGPGGAIYETNIVVAVADFAFTGNPSLTGVTVPGSVATIGEFAFDGCTNLAGISLANGLVTIGEFAFADCSALDGLAIPDSVTNLGDFVLSGCTNLTTLSTGNGITNLDTDEFSLLPALSSVTLGTNLVSIGTDAFLDSIHLTNLVIPDRVTSLGEFAFCGSGLTTLTLPDSMLSIDADAFLACTNLARIALGDNLATIGESAFDGCSRLTNVVFPVSLTNIGASAFDGCFGLGPTINIPNGRIGNGAFMLCTGLTNVVLGAGVTEVGDQAFAFCTRLAGITLGSQVRQLGNSVFAVDEDLTGVYFEGSPPAAVGTHVFPGNTATMIVYYLSGTKGWARKYEGYATREWLVDRPTVAIITPLNRELLSNSVFTVSGTAADPAGLAGIWIQFNAGGWIPVPPITNLLNTWFANVRLSPGTNVLEAYAENSLGNSAVSAPVEFFDVVPAVLQVRTVGAGTFSPDDNNALLDIGRNYRLTAKPAKGYVFTNWTVSTDWHGGWTTNKPTVQFMMASNLTLTAGFAAESVIAGESQVSVVVAAAIQLRPAVAASAPRMSPGGLTFNLRITGAANGFIQTSPDLTSWTTLTSFAGTNTTINFCDPTAASSTRRFYRALIP